MPRGSEKYSQRRQYLGWAIEMSRSFLGNQGEGALQAEGLAGAEPWTSESIVFGAPQRAFCVCLLGGRQGLVCGQPVNKAMGLDF